MNTLTDKQWRDLKEGWGLEEVPKTLRREMVCCICAVDHPRDKLYTDRPIGPYATTHEYRLQIDKMRPNCYCRFHAERMFSEPQEGE